MPDRDVASRVIAVTGAASGIGAACMQGFLAHGYRVAGLDRDPVPGLEDRKDDAGGDSGASIMALRCDVSKEAECREAIARIVDRFGRLDGLVHMAAIHSTKTWEEADEGEFNRLMAVNVTGTFNMAKAAARAMAKGACGGAMVLAASGSMYVGGVGGHGRGGPAYVSSKAAIIGLMRSLARSFGPLGIRVNAVSPGATATAMTADYDEEALARVAERTQLSRIGRPEEIADVARFLISDEASYITGEVINVNGGGHFA